MKRRALLYAAGVGLLAGCSTSRAGSSEPEEATDDVRSINVPMTEIAVDDVVDQVLILPAEQALHVEQVSVATTDDDTNAPAVCAKVIEKPGATTQQERYTQCESAIESGDLLTIEPETHGRRIAFRLENTGTSPNSVSAVFRYTIRAVE